MKKIIITVLGILILAAGTLQAGPGDPGKGRVRHARHEVRKDKVKLHHNVKNGNRKAAHHNAKKLRHDRMKLHNARMHNHR
jgi:hypothetical protein